MPKTNATNNRAKGSKYDEFYTPLAMVEKEMKFYKNKFKDKVIYCNCDDARVSNFFKYFAYSFEFLGLKKLIATSYKKDGNGTYFCYEGDNNGNRIVDEEEITVTELSGDGSFSSDECLEILKEADLIITNPPFSLFRDYIKTLIENKKDFLIIGNLNAATDKEIFPYIINGQMWLGVSMNGNQQSTFIVPDDYKDTNSKVQMIDGVMRNTTIINTASWFTNLPHKKRNEPLDLYRKYTPEEYPTYDNYDAIHVKAVADIPEDYPGKMGVPISFLGKYCPEQFELLGEANHGCDNEYDLFAPVLDGAAKYARLIIKNKNL